MLLEVRVAENDAGQRADRYIRKLCPNLLISRLRSLFRKKEIKICRKAILRQHSLSAGDILQIYGLKESETITESSDEPEKIRENGTFKLSVIYEDKGLLVLDKPVGISVHPGSGIRAGKSIIEIVRQKYLPEPREGFSPSLIHRLDKDTSGLLLVAKTSEALKKWTRLIWEGKIEKSYLSLLCGSPDVEEGTIKGLLTSINSPKGGAKMNIIDSKGKLSTTRFRVIKKFGAFTLVQANLDTGRMHQLRIHFSSINCPIAGDSRYGDFQLNRQLNKDISLRRMFLHASEIVFPPDMCKCSFFKSPLPEELKECLSNYKISHIKIPHRHHNNTI